jgi:PASTA domain-containing protein
VRKILFAALISAAVPAVAYGRGSAPPPHAPFAPPSGTLTVCNASGVRPVTGSFTYTLSTVASAGGTMTLNIAVGTCGARVFYPQGVSVTVTENVPTGDGVTGITLSPTPGYTSTTSVISSNTPSSGAASVTIGSGDATLTFTTSSTSGGIPCKVPNVFGLGLTTAKAAIRKAHCAVGIVHRAYSKIYQAGRIFSQSPPRGTVLAPNAPVSLKISLGRHP